MSYFIGGDVDDDLYGGMVSGGYESFLGGLNVEEVSTDDEAGDMDEVEDNSDASKRAPIPVTTIRVISAPKLHKTKTDAEFEPVIDQDPDIEETEELETLDADGHPIITSVNTKEDDHGETSSSESDGSSESEDIEFESAYFTPKHHHNHKHGGGKKKSKSKPKEPKPAPVEEPKSKPKEPEPAPVEEPKPEPKPDTSDLTTPNDEEYIQFADDLNNNADDGDEEEDPIPVGGEDGEEKQKEVEQKEEAPVEQRLDNLETDNPVSPLPFEEANNNADRDADHEEVTSVFGPNVDEEHIEAHIVEPETQLKPLGPESPKSPKSPKYPKPLEPEVPEVPEVPESPQSLNEEDSEKLGGGHKFGRALSSYLSEQI